MGPPKRSWGFLGASGALLGPLGSLLGASWGSSWGVLGPPGSLLGPPGSLLGTILGPLGGSLGPLWGSWSSWNGLGEEKKEKRNQKYGFGGQKGSQKVPKIDPRGIKKHIRNASRFQSPATCIFSSLWDNNFMKLKNVGKTSTLQKHRFLLCFTRVF